ncbi:MAG: hypothetical protein AXA67_06905 [Methylothermaceae bacteria B42]|nr:MAG: hypothetical protein AXA67_06905 [Methylothermaceae bacteria B42]HHJ40247.1 DUF1820 family protein [Methylothermaceae bacterium]
MATKQIFKVAFVNQNQVYEIYAKRVYQGDLYGFVVVEDFVFGEASSIVVDPSEEKLKAEFENVKRSFIPMHEIIRIDMVERRGTAKILPLKEVGGSSKGPSFYTPDKK